MNKIRLSLAFLLLVASSGVIWTGLVHAQSFMSMTSSNQTVNSSLYSVSQNVDIEGTINGDVYCAGQNITIDATVHGDVLCAGQTITVSGHIDGSLRAIGQTIVDSANVGRSVSIAAQTATITKQARVGSDASFAGQGLTLNGHVGRDLAVRGGTLNINGNVGRRVQFGGSNLQVGQAAHILGALDYNSPQAATIAKSAVIAGGTHHTAPPVKTQTPRAALASWATTFLYLFAALLLLGLAIVLFMPQVIRTISEEPLKHLGRTALNGFVLFILEPIIVIFLIATFVGVPLAFVCLLVFLLVGIFSIPVAAYYIGTLLLSKSEHAVLTMTVGMFVLVFLLLIPVVGVFAAIATYFIGAGALVASLKRHLPRPVYKVK
jgi:cytoskeletal protein CcmA (bactofilin family)